MKPKNSLSWCTTFARLFGIAFINLVAMNSAHAHTFGPARNPLICLAEHALDRTMGTGLGWHYATTASEMLAAIDPNSSPICKEWLEAELHRILTDRGQVAVKNCLIMSDEDAAQIRPNIPLTAPKAIRESFVKKAMEQKESIIGECKVKVTSQMLIAANSTLSSRYEGAAVRETAATKEAAEIAAKAKVRADHIEANRNSVRNFEIKGLSLVTTRAQLLSMGSPKGEWKCKEDPISPEVEFCVAQLAADSCYTTEQFVAGGLLSRKVQQCDTTYFRPDGVSPGMRAFLTLGGVPVKRLEASFYSGRLIRISIYPGKYDPAIEIGLTEKYGRPDQDAEQRKEWIGLDESLIVRGWVSIERPSLVEQSRQRQKQAQEAISNEQLRRTEESTNQKKKDI